MKTVYEQKDFIKSQEYEINLSIDNLDSIDNYSINILGIRNLNVNGHLDYNAKEDCLIVTAKISSDLIIEDAVTLEHFDYHYEGDWNDSFSFKFDGNSEINYLNEGIFDIIKYAWDEINMNIPINLSQNHSKILSGDSSYTVMSEDEYQAIYDTDNKINK